MGKGESGMAFESLQNGLLAAAGKIESNKYLNSIKNAFTIFVPFIVVGSFGTLLNTLIAGGQRTGKMDSGTGKTVAGIFHDELCHNFLYVSSDCIPDRSRAGKT